MAFKRTVEDFVCEHCGTQVVGTGYTNHCPKCLCSKHVDVHPGDRTEACGGMMKPVALEGSTPDYRLVHVCERCGMRRYNRMDVADDPSAVIALAQRFAKDN